MTYQFDNRFDATAIRLDALPNTAGALAGLRPVVLFAQQGASSAGLERPTAVAPSGGEGAEQFFAGSYADHRKNDPIGKLTPQFELNRVIFIIDRSGSMEGPAAPGLATQKIDYIREKISRLQQTYLSPSCKVAVIDFDDVATPVECGRVDKGGIANLQKHVDTLKAGSGTQFSPPLREAVRILEEDREHAVVAGIPVAEIGLRTAVVFLTDGDDRGEANVLKLCQRVRDHNAMLFVGGIGEHYKMARILELASHAGASTWSHMPPEKGAPDVFDDQLPRFFNQLQSCEHYFRFQAEGTFDTFSALSPSIRFALPKKEELYTGYEQEPVGVLFERNDDLRLHLTAGRTVGDMSPYKFEIPIVDADDAVGKFEQVTQARDLSDRFLVFKAMLNRDVGALRAMMEINPSLAEAIGDAVNDMDEQARYGNHGTGTQSVHSTMSSVGYTISDFNLGNQAPSKPPAGDTMRNDGAGYTVVGGRTDPAGQPAPQQGGKNPIDDMLHSGRVGPLSAPPPDQSLGAPSHFNTEPYKNLQPIKEVPLLSWGNGFVFQPDGAQPSSEINLEQLLFGKNYAFGRSASSGDVKIVVAYDTISREHFKILTRDGKFFVEDLGSMNGTKLNGNQIKGKGQVEIKFGDVISICKFPPMVFKAPAMK